jgi:glutamate synthase (NADPH/NADH) large chain
MTGGVVVVLGATGRNFAAGMSGGIAYVLDQDGSFSSRCNLAMVDLEPMPDEEDINAKVFHHARDLEAHGLVDIMSDLSSFDGHRLHQLIARHARFTGSALADKILKDWTGWYPKFRKIMPVEYRRALNELKAAAIAAE